MKEKNKKNLSISLILFGLLLVSAIDITCGVMYDWLTAYFGGRGTSNVSHQTFLEADLVCQEIENEGIVLLKNENNTLPLKDAKKINVFGWAATDAGFVLSGSGSGSAIERGGGAGDVVTFLNGLKKVGLEYNEKLISSYESFASKKDGTGKSLDDAPEIFFKLYDPPKEFYTPKLIQEALDYSSIALIVISRNGGEGPDLPNVQFKYNNKTDESRHYLELSSEEEDMINVVTSSGFSKVVVIINSCNVMELGFLDNEKIGGALLVGGPGQSGCISIGNTLVGKNNPSGRVVDTYAYDLTTAASYNNAPMSSTWYGSEIHGVKKYSNMNTEEFNQYIDYAEGIYVGYKWYETAYVERYFDNYNRVVQYPFGYGLSYTSFKWEVIEMTPRSNAFLEADGEVKISVKVTNVGDIAGKDVVELYYSAPYTSGGIEKSSISLIAFNKTSLLKPNESEIVDLKFNVEDMKSYDDLDKNNNKFCGYELEKGEYKISLRNNVHQEANCSNSTITYRVKTNIRFENDLKTNNPVINRFTGKQAYGRVSINGSTTEGEIKYLSRANFKETFPQYNEPREKNAKLIAMGNHWYDKTESIEDEPLQGEKGDLSLTILKNGKREWNDELVSKLGSNYDDPTWEELLNQISVKELKTLVEMGGFKTSSVKSICKPECVDLDGPTGLNLSVASIDGTSWTSYPIEIVLACTWNEKLAYEFGSSVGKEASESNVSGWYAPGANMHRTPFSGRNFEYFAEDSLLSGKMAANVTLGALEQGLYCYIKHFAVNEVQTNPAGVYVWLNEQSLREIYLKPFEIAIKEGKANAIMSSFNRIGSIWTGGNKALLTDIVRNEWGFRGSIITDWSSGGDYMNVDQGLRAGNDLWLTGAQLPPSGHKSSSAWDIAVMRNAVKNILFTYCNTYCIAKNAGTNVGISSKQNVFPIWILIPIGITSIYIGTITTLLIIKKKKKKK